MTEAKQVQAEIDGLVKGLSLAEYFVQEFDNGNFEGFIEPSMERVLSRLREKSKLAIRNADFHKVSYAAGEIEATESFLNIYRNAGTDLLQARKRLEELRKEQRNG